MAGKAALAFRRMLTGGFHTAGSKHTGASDPNRVLGSAGQMPPALAPAPLPAHHPHDGLTLEGPGRDLYYLALELILNGVMWMRPIRMMLRPRASQAEG